MPNGEGLRQCSSEKFTLLKELIEIYTANSADLPYSNRMPSELLPLYIAGANNGELKVDAQLEYWRD